MPSSVSEGSSSMKKTLMRFLKPRKMRHIRYNIISNLDILVQILFFSWKENVMSQRQNLRTGFRQERCANIYREEEQAASTDEPNVYTEWLKEFAIAVMCIVFLVMGLHCLLLGQTSFSGCLWPHLNSDSICWIHPCTNVRWDSFERRYLIVNGIPSHRSPPSHDTNI